MGSCPDADVDPKYKAIDSQISQWLARKKATVSKCIFNGRPVEAKKKICTEKRKFKKNVENSWKKKK